MCGSFRESFSCSCLEFTVEFAGDQCVLCWYSFIPPQVYFASYSLRNSQEAVQYVPHPVWLLRNSQETVQYVLHLVWLLRNSRRNCAMRSVSCSGVEEFTRICAMRSAFCLALEEFTRNCALRSVSCSGVEEFTKNCAMRSVSCSALEEFTRVCAMRSVSCLAPEEFTRICVQCVLYPVRLLRNSQETVQCVLYPVLLLRNSKESVHNSFYLWFGAWTRICEIRSVSHSALEELTRIRAIRSVSCSALEEFTRICAFLLCPVRLLRNSQEWSVLSLYIRFGSWAIHSSCNFLLGECGSWRKQEEAATKIKGCREEGFMTQWSHLENVFPAVFCMSWEQHMLFFWSTDDCMNSAVNEKKCQLTPKFLCFLRR